MICWRIFKINTKVIILQYYQVGNSHPSSHQFRWLILQPYLVLSLSFRSIQLITQLKQIPLKPLYRDSH